MANVTPGNSEVGRPMIAGTDTGSESRGATRGRTAVSTCRRGAARKVGHTAIYSGARRQMMHVVWKRKGVAYYVGLAKTLLEAWAE